MLLSAGDPMSEAQTDFPLAISKHTHMAVAAQKKPSKRRPTDFPRLPRLASAWREREEEGRGYSSFFIVIIWGRVEGALLCRVMAGSKSSRGKKEKSFFVGERRDDAARKRLNHRQRRNRQIFFPRFTPCNQQQYST